MTKIKLTKGTIVRVVRGDSSTTFATRIPEGQTLSIMMGLLKKQYMTTGVILSTLIEMAPTCPVTESDCYNGFPMLIVDVQENTIRRSTDCWANWRIYRLEYSVVTQSKQFVVYSENLFDKQLN